jgi:hypothetical protein
MSNAGLTDSIRTVLAAADDSLSVRQVADALATRGITAAFPNVRSLLRQRTAAGEFVQSEIAGNVCYTLTPDYRPAKRGAPKAKSGQTKPAKAPAPARAVDREQELGARISRLFSEVIDDGLACTATDVTRLLKGDWNQSEVFLALAREAEAGRLATRYDEAESASVFWLPDADAREAAAQSSVLFVDVAPLPPARLGMRVPERPRLGLVDRLQAVATDLEDAIGDACDGELPHEVIKALVLANGATQRALRRLAA